MDTISTIHTALAQEVHEVRKKKQLLYLLVADAALGVAVRSNLTQLNRRSLVATHVRWPNGRSL